MIKKIICRLRELLIYIFKEIPIILLIKVWTVTRVITTIILVIYIMVDRFLKNDLNTFILDFIK
jgi:hypothetical protein